jgi:TonB family protein
VRRVTATVIVLGGMASAGAPKSFVTAVVRELGRPPVKDERAAETWSLATTKVQSEAVISDLQNLLRGDPKEEVRFAAAWALGHLRMKETGEEAHAYDEPPRLERQTKPSYPREAFLQRVQGTVLVEFLIDERGRVAHAEVRESIRLLDQAALDTVREWRFIPARSSGQPVASAARAPLTFRIGK